METYDSMYGVMVKNKITVCKTLKQAQILCDEEIKRNEFANSVMSIHGGYKIVELQVKVIETIDDYNKYIHDVRSEQNEYESLRGHKFESIDK